MSETPKLDLLRVKTNKESIVHQVFSKFRTLREHPYLANKFFRPSGSGH